MFSYKIFTTDSDKMLAICDASLLGKKFEQGELCIEVSEFYEGTTCSGEEAVNLARSATIVNAVGNKIIELLMENKIVDESAVLVVGGTMHAQVVTVQ